MAHAQRPTVTVVMPFGGNRAEVSDMQEALRSLELGPEDELVVADNSGAVAGLNGVIVLPATRERSPAHARNVGAAAAGGEWILFIDADCRPRPELLEAYFAEPIGDTVGALAGEVLGVPQPPNARDGGADGNPIRPPLAARYGAAKSFLSQRQHLAHPYRPRAVAANLLVRRAAFEQVGGFYEGLRAAEDTDFTWRLQQAGWRLELRADAWVEHRYRTNLNELRRQWRGYAAGRAWLARRYDGFAPEPALSRALKRVRRTRRSSAAMRPVTPRANLARADADRLERGKYLAMDALLALEELAGLALSNRPAEGEPQTGRSVGAPVVFVADRFPSPDDPLTELPSSLGARVEAAARPQRIPPEAHVLRIHYREDDGFAERLRAATRLLVAHPVCCLRDVLARRAGEASLMALAPAAGRLQREPDTRVQPLGGGGAETVARRLQALAGRRPR